MEAWQEKYLVANGSQLLEKITVNSELLTSLKARQILSSNEADAIRRKEDNSAMTYTLLDIARTRINGYKHLVYALFEYKQSGAFEILMKGYVENVTPNIKIQWGETVAPISKILDQAAITKVCEKMKDITPVRYVKLYTEANSNEAIIKLLYDTIPVENEFYIPRSLSKRVCVNKKLFQVHCTDVFVIKEIDAKRLGNLTGSGSKLIGNSSSQLHKLDKRFIILDYEGDWDVLHGLSTNPIHLINYQKLQGDEHFILEGSSGGSTVLHSFMLPTRQKVVLEENLVEEIQKTSKSGICICDVPGMGKSLLLASIAKKFAARCPDRLVAFIRLSSFMKHVTKHKRPSTATFSDFVTNALFEYMSPSLLAKFILDKLLKQNSIGFDIFFDGFDEIQSQHVELTKSLLQTVDINFPNTRLYVTSRPHMRHELEASLKVISYDILPFKHENQVHFLSSFWKRQCDQGCDKRRKEFAEFCLKKLEENLSKEERQITGVPLQCRLVAEVFARNAKLYSDPLRTVPIDQLCRFEGTFAHIYKRYFALRFSQVSQEGSAAASLPCTEQEKGLTNVVASSSSCTPVLEPMSQLEQQRFSRLEHLKQYHFYKAVKTLFPNCIFEFPSAFKTSTTIFDSETLFRIGLLERGHDGKRETREFLHRTFAEYLAAEGFVKIFDKSWRLAKNMERSLLRVCFMAIQPTIDTSRPLKNPSYVQPIFVHFLNFVLGENMNVSCRASVASAFSISVPCKGLYKLLKVLLLHRHSHLLMLVKNIISKVGIVKRFNCRRYLFRKNFRYIGQLVVIAVKNLSPSDVAEMFPDFFGLDLLSVCKKLNNSDSSPLAIAVENTNVEMVELFIDKVSLRGGSLANNCFAKSYGDSAYKIEQRINIFNLLLSKHNGLVTEQKDFLCDEIWHPVNLKCIKLLLRNGANPYATNDRGETVVHHAAKYLSPEDLHELCRFLIEDYLAVGLFMQKRMGGKSPMEVILSKENIETIKMIELALKPKSL